MPTLICKEEEIKKDLVSINSFLHNLISSQSVFENNLEKRFRRGNGIFFTNRLETIDNILDIVSLDNGLLEKKILEPSCGQGVFLLKLISQVYFRYPHKDIISDFIQDNLVFVDIDNEMVNKTKSNLKQIFKFLFGSDYNGNFNSYNFDFTKKSILEDDLFFSKESNKHPLADWIGKIDYVVGNPPYVTLYGRRDKKINEQQRIYYLNNYKQFPAYVENGKLNFIMLFLEHSLDFMKSGGMLSFIIDVSFFETAYLYTRKYLLENTKIIALDYNISDFKVGSGQVILKLQKEKANEDHAVRVYNREKGDRVFIKQSTWHNPCDEYKFRINQCGVSDQIIRKILARNERTIRELYPSKNLRTCTMLLDMEDNFTTNEYKLKKDIDIYPYYQGSKSLQVKYGSLSFEKYFSYDKKLQDKINEELKRELAANGIKNKKRIGFGELAVYDNPKVFIRQSAKEIIATYDATKSSANNSLYVFSLRDNSGKSKKILQFICGFLNSDLITFYAQKKSIIRYAKGKQPQIKISDLSSIRLPEDIQLQGRIADLVQKIYSDVLLKQQYMKEINEIIFTFYGIKKAEIDFLIREIKSF